MQYEQLERQAADIYTKAFLDGGMWDHVLRLIGVGDPSVMAAASEKHFWASPPPTKFALPVVAVAAGDSGDTDQSAGQLRCAPLGSRSAGAER